MRNAGIGIAPSMAVLRCAICGRSQSQTTSIDLHKAPHVRGTTATVERAQARGVRRGDLQLRLSGSSSSAVEVLHRVRRLLLEREHLVEAPQGQSPHEDEGRQQEYPSERGHRLILRL